MRVFGTGTRTVRRSLGRATLPCASCGHSTEQAVSARRTWVTLLYVGVVPMPRSYLSTCSVCKSVAMVDRADAEALVTPPQ
jgi:hypothetical protein